VAAVWAAVLFVYIINKAKAQNINFLSGGHNSPAVRRQKSHNKSAS